MNNLPVYHFDQAWQNSLAILQKLTSNSGITRSLLSPDIFARIRVAVWSQLELSNVKINNLEMQFTAACGPFWGGLWVIGPGTAPADSEIAEQLWQEGVPLNPDDTIRINERYRNLTVWLKHPLRPPWEADMEAFPPIVSFYAFKGGTGRSTALAIFAAHRAQAGKGQRVVIIDLDLAAPGISFLLANEKTDIDVIQYGVVDYWLEQPLIAHALDLREYYFPVIQPDITGAGEILVFPSGRFDDQYLSKLARLDFVPPVDGEDRHPLKVLLEQIRQQLQPDWILLDARAGISEVAGFALGGLAHLNVIFGNATKSSWRGLRQVIRRLGAARVRQNLPQEDCLLVYGMAPANPAVMEIAQEEFMRQAEAVFEQEYYLSDPENPDEDKFWYLRDMENLDAPHIPVILSYSEQIAFFTRLEQLIRYGLESTEYQRLDERITARFPEKSR
ncbi:MAG: hypothetical protein D6784_10810 [Chloroflexi bacterium]|nr:MAG: hypothetical protein D6784_10810 [Chloroflexota bacterium]